MIKYVFRPSLAVGLCLLIPQRALSNLLPDAISLHVQATGITQGHGGMVSPYSGPNSLSSQSENQTSVTSTLFLGARFWEGGELYVNPEMFVGEGLSSTSGMAGFPNGEAERVGTREPRVFMDRLFFRRTFGLGEVMEEVPAGQNKIAQRQATERVVFTLGKMSVTDLFDDNTYSHDPRTQFLNWGLMTNAAFDFPADTRGYTWGGVVESIHADWAWRLGSFLLPEEANGAKLEWDMSRAHGEVIESERKYFWGSHPGKTRFLGYLNHAHMGHYRTAIELMPASPDLAATRRTGNMKYGFGLNVEQEIMPDLGMFMRVGWDDGHTETWAFTEADRTASLGLSVKGAAWKRSEDVFGLAGLVNGLSNNHRDYLAAGGLGFELGDGRLNYATENIVETYYLIHIWKGISLTADFQGVSHPGYNKDRGPAAIWAGRLHCEF